MVVHTIQHYKYYFIILRLLVYIIIPIALLILPVNFFDHGESICLSKTLLNVECYACGMTRAVMHLIHFDWEDAYFFNPLSFLAFPILATLWLNWFLIDIKLLLKNKFKNHTYSE
jgi:hypothetical protein